MMKLFYTQNSPYSRKVRVTAREKGLANKIKEIIAPPSENPPELFKANPLGAIPTLVLANAEPIYDSPVICACLDSLAQDKRLIPTSGFEKIHVLRGEALADGMMDAAVGMVYERMRPSAEQSTLWINKRTSAIVRSLPVLALEIETLTPQTNHDIDLRYIAYACALGYIEFRHPNIEWKQTFPTMTRWYEEFNKRPSMKETAPGEK